MTNAVQMCIFKSYQTAWPGECLESSTLLHHHVIALQRTQFAVQYGDIASPGSKYGYNLRQLGPAACGRVACWTWHHHPRIISHGSVLGTGSLWLLVHEKILSQCTPDG